MALQLSVALGVEGHQGQKAWEEGVGQVQSTLDQEQVVGEVEQPKQGKTGHSTQRDYFTNCSQQLDIVQAVAWPAKLKM